MMRRRGDSLGLPEGTNYHVTPASGRVVKNPPNATTRELAHESMKTPQICGVFEDCRIRRRDGSDAPGLPFDS